MSDLAFLIENCANVSFDKTKGEIRFRFEDIDRVFAGGTWDEELANAKAAIAELIEEKHKRAHWTEEIERVEPLVYEVLQGECDESDPPVYRMTGRLKWNGNEVYAAIDSWNEAALNRRLLLVLVSAVSEK